MGLLRQVSGTAVLPSPVKIRDSLHSIAGRTSLRSKLFFSDFHDSSSTSRGPDLARNILSSCELHHDRSHEKALIPLH